MRMTPASAAPNPRDEVCCARTQTSHAADAYMGNANTCFSVSIQAPGFGSTRRVHGANDSSRYGSDRPTPKPAKITRATTGDCVSAAPTAAAMNGAVQGVATNVVSTPVKNDAR